MSIKARCKKIMLVASLLTIGSTKPSHALTIGMVDVGWDWVNQYAVGMCSSPLINSQGYLTWAQLQQAGNATIQIAPNDPICIVGHGAPGIIGPATGAQIAAEVLAKIVRPAGQNNPILLIACNSAVAPAGGQSVLAAFQNLGNPNWVGNPVNGSLGICVANRNGAAPLYQMVLVAPLPTTGLCSFGSLKAVQVARQINIERNIVACSRAAGDLAIGQCLYNDPEVEADFYQPFLQYITNHQCNQPGPGVPPNMPAGVQQGIM